MSNTNSCEAPCRAQSLSPASRVPHTALSSQVSGLLYPSPRQSLELKTGVSNHSLGLLITARLRTRSPAADSALPRPLLHIPPPPDSGRGAVRPAAPPSPFLERKSATAICAPGLWTTLNLKGCKARYQRVIRALVSFMRWSHWRGAWSEQRVNSRPRR